jgi:hypothetical protein
METLVGEERVESMMSVETQEFFILRNFEMKEEIYRSIDLWVPNPEYFVS